MVLVYIEAKVGDFTVYFDRPIKNFGSIALRSCAFYNHWKNLSSEGTISDGKNILLRIPAGHYTLETLKRKIDSALYVGTKPITVEKSSITANQILELNESFTNLLGLERSWLKPKTSYEIRLKTLDSTFIHCDLVSTASVLKQDEEDLLKPSQILAEVPVNKGSGERVSFTPYSPIRLGTDTSGGCVNSVRLCVKDRRGSIVNNIYPITFTLELT